jgi:hypothetical protein
MTITFDNDSDIIVYALEKLSSHARRTQPIFVPQCVWWLVSVIGLEQDLVHHIDNLHGRTVMGKDQHDAENSTPKVWNSSIDRIPVPKESTRDQQDSVLKECEEYQKESQRLRDIFALKF